MAHKQLSIRTYSTMFAVFSILTFVAVTFICFNEIKGIHANVINKRIVLIEDRFKKSISTLQDDINKYSRTLLNLEELRAQIRKNNRVKGFGDNKYIINVDILDLKGVVYTSFDNVIGNPKKSVSMDILDATDRHFTISIDNGNLVLNHYRPIISRSDKKGLAAYLHITMDLDTFIKDNTGNYDKNISAIKYNIPMSDDMLVSELLSNIKFDMTEFSDVDVIIDSVYSGWYKLFGFGIAFLLLSLYVICNKFSNPLKNLSNCLDNANLGQNSCRLDIKNTPASVAEINVIGNALIKYQHKIDTLHNELRLLVYEDSMTHVYNRRKFDEDWDSIEQQRLNRVSVILFDCDNFKSINDTYGHHIGDSVITITAKLLTKVVRGSDDVYRLGGDEFCIVLKDAGPDEAKDIAERCMTLFEEYDFCNCGIFEPVTVSAGISSSNNYSELVDVLKHADAAMYYAKKPTNNCIQIYDDKMDDVTDSILNNSITASVVDAARNAMNIHMVYQRIESFKDPDELYFESLVRIMHNDNESVIYPDKIFPIVEKKNMICEFDTVIISRVFSDIRSGIIPEGAKIAINISGESVMSESVMGLLIHGSDIIKRNPIVIELTENEIIPRVGIVMKNLNRLKSSGYLLALDDFGSGYSSLRYLVSLPIDIVKFDITMINDLMAASDKEKDIMKHIVEMVDDMDAVLIAEGIETQAIYDMVKSINFDYGQGYHIHIPQCKELVPAFGNIAGNIELYK